MAQIVKLRRSAVSGQKPTNSNLQLGELAQNTTDGKIFLAKSGSGGPSIEEIIVTNTSNTGSINLLGSVTASSFTGSFIGDGALLYNIPASGVTGLQLDRISSGNVSASISPSTGLVINTGVTITGSISATEFTGSGLGLTNVPFHISGSDVDGNTYDKQFTKLQFDDGTGLNVSESVDGTAFISIGSHFRDIFVSGSDMLRATGSDAFEIIPEGGIEITTSITDTNSNGYIKELKLSTTTLSSSFNTHVQDLSSSFNTRIQDLSGSVVYQSETSSMTVLSSSFALTASFALNAGAGNEGRTFVHVQSTPSTYWIVTHNLGEEYPAITVFDSSDNVIIPSKITTVDETRFTVEFSSDQTGRVSATVGGGLPFVSASFVDYVLAVNNDVPYWKGGIISGSAQIILSGATGYSDFSSSIDSTITSLSSSIAATDLLDDQRLDTIELTTASLNSYTASTDSRLSSIETSTGSLNTFSSSTLSRLGSLETESGSIRTAFNTFTSSYLVVSASLDSRLDILETYSGSYTGSFSGSNLDIDNIDFNLSTTTPDAIGRLKWDDGNGTLTLGLKGGNVNLSVGQENVTLVYNAESTALVDGEIVYTIGSQGNRIAVKRASASAEFGSANTIGMVTEPIAAGGEGFITTFGMVNGLNTTGLTQNEPLWLSTTPGQFTQTKPVAPNHGVLIGFVERVHKSAGSIFVKVDNGYEIGELHDVIDSTTTSSFGDLMVKSGSVWITGKNLTGSYNIVGSLNATSLTGSINFNNLTNVPTLISGSSQVILTGTTGYTDFSSSIATTTLNIETRVGSLETESGSIRSAFNSYTSSTNSRLNSIETSTGSLNTFSSSANIRLGALETESGSIRTDFNSYTSSNDSTNTTQNNRLTSLEEKTGSYATTGSNSFNGSQTITGSLIVTADLTVLGSSSLVYVTSSQLSVSSSTISVNVFEPAERFGGLKVYDSGSSTATASLLWDSLHNHWIYQNVSGAAYSGGMFLSGPRNTGSLGDEPGLITNRLPKSVGGDHLDNSSISDTGTKVSINSNTEITGTFVVTGTALVSGSSQIDHNTTTNYVANEHINHTSVSISAGNGLSGGGDISTTRTLTLDTGSVHFTGGVKTKMNSDGVVSSSAQIVAALPSGTVSGSSQVLNGSGVWSGSAQLPSGVVSGSSQISFSGISGVPSGLVSGSSQISFGSISGIPSGLVSGSSQISFGSISGVPSGLVSGSSQITFSGISSKPTTLSGYGITDAIKSNGTLNNNIDSDWGESFTTFDPIPSGTPPLSSPNIRTINVGPDYNRRTQLAFDYASDKAYFRRRTEAGWFTWREFIHSGNISSQSVSYATTAGALTSMNISQFTNNSGYITSYTETDTLATVTARGASTSTALSLSGKVTFSSTVASRPQFPGGILGLDTGDGNFDIWGISRDYYPSHGTAANAWGLRWNGDNNDFEFVGNGTNKVILDMDGGVVTATSFSGTIAGSNVSGNISGNAANITSYTINQNLGTSNSPTFAGLTSNGVGVFNSTNDTQISLRSTDTWAGIEFDDSGSPDYIWYHGGSQTFAIGGGGSNVSGKKLHVHGGMTIGSGYPGTSVSTNGLNVEGAIVAPTIQASNGNDAAGVYFRSTNEVMSGEGWCTAIYNYNNNDGVLVLARDGGTTARPIFHIGGYNNAGYAGYSDGDSMITLVRADGTKTTGSTYAGRGLSNSSYYANIIKTSSKTVFRDTQSYFEFIGSVLPSANNTYNLGSASLGWANVYTNDLHLSNMNKPEGNDIDGTNGNWTIQEGAENLYIINNNNGKKYKITLEEI